VVATTHAPIKHTLHDGHQACIQVRLLLGFRRLDALLYVLVDALGCQGHRWGGTNRAQRRVSHKVAELKSQALLVDTLEK
jgi:hypothetical protein